MNRPPRHTTPSRRIPGVTVAVYGLLGLVVFGLALLFAPTGDDWSRLAFTDRSPGGYLAQARQSYVGHNGRIVGNSLSFLLIEPAGLRAAAKALTVVALVWLMQRVTGARSAWGALACFAGVFLVPAGMFRESYVWSAGFFNYVPPMIGVLHLVGTAGGRWPSTRWTHPPRAALLSAILGFVTCLFVEHVTVAVVVIAVSAFALRLVGGRPDAALTGWAVGAVAGTAVMFASPGLDEVASNEDAYFSYAASLRALLETGVVNYSTITGSFALSNPVLMVLLVGSLVAVALRTGSRGPANAVVVVGGLLVAAYALLSRLLVPEGLRCVGGIAGCSVPLLTADLVALTVLSGVVVVAGLRCVPRGVDRAVGAALLAATVLMLAPLLVVAPIGPRNVFGPTVTVVAIAVLMARDAFHLQTGRSRLVARAGIASLVAVGLSAHLLVHSRNFATHTDRVRVMETAVVEGTRQVELAPFPFPSWVHDAEDEKIGNKYFIDEPRDIATVFK